MPLVSNWVAAGIGAIAAAAVGVLLARWISLRRRQVSPPPTGKTPLQSVVSVNCLQEENVFVAVKELVEAMPQLETVADCVLFLRSEKTVEVVTGSKFKTKKLLSARRLVVFPESLIARLSALVSQNTDTEDRHLTSVLRSNPRAYRLAGQLLEANRMLSTLEERRRVEFNPDDATHEALLQDLWAAAFGSSCQYERPSERWGELGFQGTDPVTDLRGGGMLALDCLAELGRSDPALLHRMMVFNKKQLADKLDSWYLPAVVSIQLTVLLLVPQNVVANFTPNLCLGKKNLAVLFAGSMDGRGFFQLHQALLRKFVSMWEADLPHVMEYNTWVPKVYQAFCE